MTQHSNHTPKSAMLDFSRLGALRTPVDAGNQVWMIVRQSESGDNEHRTTIAAEHFTIGRRSDNDLCLTNKTVSGSHARLEVTDGRLFLTDCGSTNGTLVNGRRVTERTELHDGDAVHFGQVAFFVESQSANAEDSSDFSNKTFVADVPEDAVLYQGFDRLLNRPDIDPYFQPVVNLSDWSTVGYEVLVRSKIEGLEFPDRIFRIAAMRMAEARLSEVCRSEGLLAGIQLDPNGKYFLNTHAAELETNRLKESLKELRDDFPNMSIVLEVHESAITSVQYLQELSRLLADLNIQLAYDDFGAGQARLIELFEIPPAYLKFDISLIRSLDTATAVHKASVKSLVSMVRDLNVVPLAEGIETQEQAEVCGEIGFQMAQGYFFGRPAPREFWTQHLISVDTQQFPSLAAKRSASAMPPPQNTTSQCSADR